RAAGRSVSSIGEESNPETSNSEPPARPALAETVRGFGPASVLLGRPPFGASTPGVRLGARTFSTGFAGVSSALARDRGSALGASSLGESAGTVILAGGGAGSALTPARRSDSRRWRT